MPHPNSRRARREAAKSARRALLPDPRSMERLFSFQDRCEHQADHRLAIAMYQTTNRKKWMRLYILQGSGLTERVLIRDMRAVRAQFLKEVVDAIRIAGEPSVNWLSEPRKPRASWNGVTGRT